MIQKSASQIKQKLASARADNTTAGKRPMGPVFIGPSTSTIVSNSRETGTISLLIWGFTAICAAGGMSGKVLFPAEVLDF